jgi:arylsulfatase A-like enzyme
MRHRLVSLAALLAGCAAWITVVEPRATRRETPLGVVSRAGAPGGPEWTTRAGAPPRVEAADSGGERRAGLRLTAPGAWSARLTLPGDARLRLGLLPLTTGTGLTAIARLHRARSTELLRRLPLTGRRWLDLELALPGHPDEAVELELALLGEGEVGLSQPMLLAPGAPGPAPHVIVYLIDCLRADHVGAYGYARPTTPHIDALARDGVVFEQAWACASWTKPSVSCLFTGQPGVVHGARTIDDALDTGVPTLAEAFGAAGYETAAFVDNPFVSAEAFGLTRGFDRVGRALVAPRKRNINSLEGDALRLHRALLPWLETRARQRYLLYAHSLDLHAEYRPRPPWTRLFAQGPGAPRDIDLYDAELRANDEAFGLLVAWLKAQGLYDRTLIVVTADHGEQFGERGAWRHGHTLDQGLLRVPLIVKPPGAARRGRRVREPVTLIDLAPTLLDLAGVERPAGLGAPGLRAALDGRGAPARRVLFAEQLSPKEALYAARDARFKAVQQFLPRPARALFDLRADPDETRDLSAAPPPEARGLLRELDAWIASGLAGWHVAVAPRDAPAAMTLEAETGARLVDVQRFAVEQDERLELSADGRRLVYRFRAGSVAHHVVLRTEPPGAPLRLRLLRAGRPLDPTEVRLGDHGARTSAAPFDLDASRATVPAQRVAELLADASVPVRVWHVAGPQRPRPEVDETLRESLRALGYVQQ